MQRAFFQISNLTEEANLRPLGKTLLDERGDAKNALGCPRQGQAMAEPISGQEGEPGHW